MDEHSSPDRTKLHSKLVTKSDPITREIVLGSVRSIQGQMEGLIERTAMSAFIREKKDFFAALFDGTGRLVVGSTLPAFGDIVHELRGHIGAIRKT